MGRDAVVGFTSIPISDFGFNTSLDNLYDGNDDVNPVVSCSPPLAAYTCGSEVPSNGSWLGTSLIASIASANLLWTQGGVIVSGGLQITGGVVLSGGVKIK